MLTSGAVLHSFLLAAMWQWDVTHPAVASRGIAVFSVVIVAGVLEVIVLGLIVSHYRPER